MHFFRDRLLAKRFRDGNVSEKEQMLYVLFYATVTAVFFTSSYAALSRADVALSLYDRLNDAVWMLLNFLAVIVCYTTNRRGDDCAFVARYFSIGFPVAIQTFLLSVPLCIGAYNIDLYFAAPGIFSGEMGAAEIEKLPSTTGPATLAASMLVAGYYIWRLNGSMRIAAGVERWRVPSTAPKPRTAMQRGMPVAGRLAKRLAQNLLNGMRLALFLRCRETVFDTSWHALWFVAALSAFMTLGRDWLQFDAPRVFNAEGFASEAAYLAFLLLGAYMVSALFRQAGSVLAVAVIVLNALVLPWIAGSLLFFACMEWADNELCYQLLWAAFVIWTFLAAFRALMLVFGESSMRHLIGAIILATAVSAPDRVFYMYDFWYQDYIEEATPQTAFDQISHEALFGKQGALLQAQIEALRPSAPGKTDVFGVVFGSHGHQEVFRREVEFVGRALEKHYGMKGRLLTLVNNEATVNDTPLAMALNLEAALRGLAGRMQDEDVAFIYLTSHGSVEEGLSVGLGYDLSFERMDAARIAAALEASGIRNRVIWVSACYSGSMIEALQGENTLIMTAAAADRTSFGCSDELEMTYFADAYFRQALPEEPDLVKAFERAKELIRKREQEEGITQHSNPQISIGDNILKALYAYKVPPPAPEPEANAAPEEKHKK